MIPNDTLGIVFALLFCLFAKFLCYFVSKYGLPMYNKRCHLSSIPEKNESEDESKVVTKWVPKKKHEVLKAKYKCLKKLFQIYDASVIGILPESYDQGDAYNNADDTNRRETHHSKRKKRSYRTKTDACAGTNEVSSGDVSVRTVDDKGSIASSVIRDLKAQCSCSTQIAEIPREEVKMCESKHSSFESENFARISERTLDFGNSRDRDVHNAQYMMYNVQRKPTRFQCFIQRLFGLRRDVVYGSKGHIYASSDNNIAYNYCEKRRRRGLRFRRLRKAKKVHSEIALRDMSSPTILNYVQSIQKNCLMDRNPRQCPILGCKIIFYGIINYNDHLNMCHFTDRKCICHYCHEGFGTEYEKFVHENEHLGVTKLKPHYQNISATSTVRNSQKTSNTQTDPDISVPEEKLKKIVSFFDKIVDTEHILTELKNNRYSEMNLPSQQSSKSESDSGTDGENVSDSNKRTVSCGNLLHGKLAKNSVTTNPSEVTSKCPYLPVKCHLCGEDFDYRRQLSHHVDLEHGGHGKPPKFHSCAGITDYKKHDGDMKFEAGKINIQSVNEVSRMSSTSLTPDHMSVVSRRKSNTLSCDPSTNIIYYKNLDTVKKPSDVNSFVGKVRSGVTNYRWEPGTKIIRV